MNPEQVGVLIQLVARSLFNLLVSESSRGDKLARTVFYKQRLYISRVIEEATSQLRFAFRIAFAENEFLAGAANYIYCTCGTGRLVPK